MEHDVCPAQRRGDGDRVANVSADDVETAVRLVSGKVFQASSVQVIQHDDLRVTIAQQAIDQMTADKASAAGNHDFA